MPILHRTSRAVNACDRRVRMPRVECRTSRNPALSPWASICLTLSMTGIQSLGMSDERPDGGFSIESLGEDSEELARHQLSTSARKYSCTSANRRRKSAAPQAMSM